MSQVPRLSVGLPVYNGENFLAESLEAMLGQSYQDFELIISDNASTDGTGDICRRYARQDSRVRYIRQPLNIGLARNHNCLVAEARGELFKWASHDDLYARDLLERCVERTDVEDGPRYRRVPGGFVVRLVASWHENTACRAPRSSTTSYLIQRYLSTSSPMSPSGPTYPSRSR